MKRRSFLKSVVALVSFPAMPKFPVLAAPVVPATAVAVPTKARFWAIYMSSLRGECTPETLQTMLKIPAVDAKNYITQLIADGVIKPNPMAHTAVSQIVKGRKSNIFDKLKSRLEMKRNSTKAEAEDLKNLFSNSIEHESELEEELGATLENETLDIAKLAEYKQEDLIKDSSLDYNDAEQETTPPPSA